MKTHVRHLLAVTALAVPVTASSAAPEPWTQAYYYQFDASASAADGAIPLRVDYARGEKVLFRARVSAAPPQTLLLPDPATVAGAKGTGGMSIVAYAGDSLVGSFDVPSFRTYNQRLRAKAPAALAQVFAAYNRLEVAPAAAKSSTTNGVSTSALATTAAQGNTPCTDACLSAYYRCMMSCSYPVNTCSRCAPEHDRCKRSCPVVDIDFDGDGLLGSVDNCPTNYNPNQENCDGDNAGDVCDTQSARYVAGPDQTCMTDKDDHVAWFSYEHHVEFVQRDSSTCGAPDIWTRRIINEATCVNIDDEDCCRLLTDTLSATGASPATWCTTAPWGVRNQDLCH